MKQRYARCTTAVRSLLAVTLLLFGWTSSSVAQQTLNGSTDSFLSLGELTMNLLPMGKGASSNCILVWPDGRFHLERKQQQLPKRVASLKVFESSLDSEQLQQLRDILKDQSIEKLPPYVLHPDLPLNVPWFQTFRATIARAKQIQSIGYWKWRGGTPGKPPNTTPERIKEDWRKAETTLRPLVDWFHETAQSASKLKPSVAEPTACQSELESD